MGYASGYTQYSVTGTRRRREGRRTVLESLLFMPLIWGIPCTASRLVTRWLGIILSYHSSSLPNLQPSVDWFIGLSIHSCSSLFKFIQPIPSQEPLPFLPPLPLNPPSRKTTSACAISYNHTTAHPSTPTSHHTYISETSSPHPPRPN